MSPRFANGATIGPYTILDDLASGGMAEVYLALNTGPSGFAKVLALKVVLPHLASEKTFVRMFEDEARIAGLLNHPGVVQVYDFGVDQSVQYMAMEYVDGPNLARTMEQLGSKHLIPTPITLRIVADICSALHYAHTLEQAGQPLRFVHRDVSLENILVSYAGQTKLGDFGIAKARTAINVTVTGALKGKYGYIAPEVLDGRGFDHRTDIYATGVALYTLLTGLFPFRRDPLVRPRPAAPRDLNPAISPELDRLVLRALEPDPVRRFQSAEEMRDELEEEMRRTGVGLPRELAAFMAETFPPGTDPLHDKYRAAMDRGTAPRSDPAPEPPEAMADLATRRRDIRGEPEAVERELATVRRGPAAAGAQAETVQLRPRRTPAAVDTVRQEIGVPTEEREASPPAEDNEVETGRQPQHTPAAYADTVSVKPSVDATARPRTLSDFSTLDGAMARGPRAASTEDRSTYRRPPGARGARSRRLAGWLALAGLLTAVPVTIVVATWPLPDSPPSKDPEPTAVPAAGSLPATLPAATRPSRITISVRASPPEASIVLDGEQITNPFRVERAPLAREAELVVSAPGHQTRRLPVSLARGGTYAVRLVPDAPEHAELADEASRTELRKVRKPGKKATAKSTEPAPRRKTGGRFSDKDVLSNPYGGKTVLP